MSLAFAALLILVLSQGAMGSAILSYAIIGPGSILAILVLMVVELLGLFPRGGDLFGFEGPSIYILVSMLMGVVFWWALALALLLYRRRKLLASEFQTETPPTPLRD